MSGLSVTTAPSTEPLTSAETIAYLRLDSGVDTTLIANLIKAARVMTENYLNRTLINTVYKLSIDAIGEIEEPLKEGIYTAPFQVSLINYIELPRSPVSAVSSVKYFSDDNTESTWATTNYYVDTVREPARIVLRDGGSWPTDLRNANGIEVNYTAGYGTNTTDVPEAIRVAMLEYITFLYEHRGEDEGRATKISPMISNLLQPFIIMRYGKSAFGGGY